MHTKLISYVIVNTPLQQTQNTKTKKESESCLLLSFYLMLASARKLNFFFTNLRKKFPSNFFRFLMIFRERKKNLLLHISSFRKKFLTKNAIKSLKIKKLKHI